MTTQLRVTSGSITNAEYLSNIASELHSISTVTREIAAIARQQVKDVSNSLATVQGDPTAAPRPNREYSEKDVEEIQNGLTREVSKNLTSSDQEARKLLEDRAGKIIASSRHQFAPVQQAAKTSANDATPEIESVRVDLDKNRGAVDIFFARITFNLPLKTAQSVKALRIFRAVITDPVFTRPLSPLSSHGIERLRSLRSRKNQDGVSILQRRLEENGVKNAISDLNPVSPYTNLRSAAGGDERLLIPPPLAGRPSNPANFDVPEALAHLDPSVLRDVRILSHLGDSFGQTNNSNVIQVGSNVSKTSLGDAQRQQILGNTPKSKVVAEGNNTLQFQEIAFFTPDTLNGKVVGNRIEYFFDDESISYGLGYKYFIVSIDENLNQSPRSSIAEITIEGLRVPERPNNVLAIPDQRLVMLTMNVNDQLVEKFEVYRHESDTNRLKQITAETISDPSGFTVTKRDRAIMDNKFLLIGEALNLPYSGGAFTDRHVKPGGSYTYRVYSVDIFGNKSESPFEVDTFIPDLQQKFLDFQKPTILAEVDATTQKIKLTFECIDDHVETLQLERRDLTTGQNSFGVPGQPKRIILGSPKTPFRRTSLEGERLFNQEPGLSWSGRFANSRKQQSFVDHSTQFDHVYQYRIYGEDRYGNRTSYEVSRPVMSIRRPIINAPLELKAEFELAAENTIGSVKLSWVESNLDKTAEEMIGNQDILEASRVRTLYQVQRKKEGEEIWQQFALLTGTTFVDPVKTDEPAPNFRPPYVEINQTYSYRVQAVQTGAFISNFTNPISIFVGFDVAPPSQLILRVPSVYVRPFYVMLNWDTPVNSGVVDRWEIERSEVNNLAAARLSLKNPADFEKLEFAQFRTVYLESSRFVAKTHDLSVEGNAKTAVLNHHFMDTMVDFGNSYFYRIRAVSPEGRKSKWIYKGIKITSAVFENKWMSQLTDTEKKELTKNFGPLEIRYRSEIIPKSTMSIQPNFSKSPSARPSPRNSSESGD